MIPGFLLIAQRDDSPVQYAKAPAMQQGRYRIWLDEGERPGHLQVLRNAAGTVIQIGEFYDGATRQTALQDALSGNSNTVATLPEGQYAAAVISAESGALTLVPDPAGIRSLFYLEKPEGLVVATSPRQLRRFYADTQPMRDRLRESFLLRHGYLPPGQGVYRGLQELTPGSALRWLDGRLELLPLPAAPVLAKTSGAGDPVDALYDLLNDIVARQVGAVRHVGVLLGGFDSALVAALLKRQGIEVETYSFQYAESSFNQPHTDTLAEHLDIRHHWVPIDSRVIADGLRSFGASCPFPTLWPGYVIQTGFVVGRMKQAGLQRCFSGDGCDTAFMGYPSTYRRGQIYRKFPRLNPGVAQGLIRTLDVLLAERWAGHPARVLKGLLRAAPIAKSDRAFRSFQVFDPDSFETLTGEPYAATEAHEALLRQIESSRGEGSFEKQVYTAKSLFSPNRCKLWSAQDIFQGLICSPYLDPSLKAFAGSLPDGLLRDDDSQGDIGKKLLVEMALSKDLLPREIIHQPKLAAVASPVDRWFARDIRPLLLEMAKRLPFRIEPNYLDSMLDDLWVERFYKRYLSSDQVVGVAASLLVTYAAFYGDDHES